MISNELLDYLKKQKDDKYVLDVTKNVRNLISSLNALKKGVSGRLSDLYMKGDIEGIHECIDFGEKIDEFIDEMSVMDFGSHHETVEMRVVTHKVCPRCGVQMNNGSISYLRFTDQSKKEVQDTLTAATYECPVCQEQFLPEKMAELMDLTVTNIEITDDEYNEQKAEAVSDHRKPVTARKMRPEAEGEKKMCVLCGKPAWKDSEYCKEHMVYRKEVGGGKE